jgi:hypothetical protein
MVDNLLGDPDEFRKNWRHRGAAPMRLYDARRVTLAQDKPWTLAWLAKAKAGQAPRHSEKRMPGKQRGSNCSRQCAEKRN